jgi:hypothetical protein
MKGVLFTLMLVLATLAHGAITVTGKHCSGKAANGGSGPAGQSCTWNVAPSVGETIHCLVYNNSVGGQTSTIFTVSDSAGNSYTANGTGTLSTQSSIGEMYEFFDAVNIAISPTSTSAAMSYYTAYQGLACFSTTGEATTSPADGSPVMATTSANGSSLSLTISPAGSADLAECGALASFAISPGSGYSSIPTTGITQIYKVLNAGGAQTASISIAGSGAAADLVCATYRSAPSPTIPPAVY